MSLIHSQPFLPRFGDQQILLLYVLFNVQILSSIIIVLVKSMAQIMFAIFT